MLEDRHLLLAGSGAALLLIVLLSLCQPGTLALLPSCPFHALTGLYCPGCGVTRMLYCLAHGEFALAWHENALGFLMLPGAVLWGVRQWRKDPAAPVTPTPVRWLPLFIGAVVLFGVARNLPWEPFQRLAPVELLPMLIAVPLARDAEERCAHRRHRLTPAAPAPGEVLQNRPVW